MSVSRWLFWAQLASKMSCCWGWCSKYWCIHWFIHWCIHWRIHWCIPWRSNCYIRWCIRWCIHWHILWRSYWSIHWRIRCCIYFKLLFVSYFKSCFYSELRMCVNKIVFASIMDIVWGALCVELLPKQDLCRILIPKSESYNSTWLGHSLSVKFFSDFVPRASFFSILEAVRDTYKEIALPESPNSPFWRSSPEITKAQK